MDEGEIVLCLVLKAQVQVFQLFRATSLLPQALQSILVMLRGSECSCQFGLGLFLGNNIAEK